jgi:pyruvate, water dikinase
MKNWLKKLIHPDSKSKNSLLENFQAIYHHFRTLIESRASALAIIRGDDPEMSQDLSQSIGMIIGALNMISNQCSLDLVKKFQDIQDGLGQNPGRRLSSFTPPLFQNQIWPNPGPFPVKELHGLEDLLDYTHELAVEEMFDLLDRFDPSWSKAIKAQTGLPINLHIIDLGGGLFSGTEKKLIRKEEILSEPMLAMFKGMYHPGISWSGPIGVNLKGLMVIMAQSTSRPEEDFWDKTYALLTGEYMNYNSRLGYHYTSVDAYVCDNPDNNHVRFLFKGGAADDVRRSRRARFIGAVLEKIGFEVVVQKDLVNARLLHQDRACTEKNLDLIGRLMGCSRQRDMVMNDESIVSWHVEAFMQGNYGFDTAK